MSELNTNDLEAPVCVSDADKIAALEAEVKSLRRKINHYDEQDIVRSIGLMMAGGLRIAAYRVRDPETKAFGAVQFHMTYNNRVMALMSEEAAKVFCQFVKDTLEPEIGPK